VAGAFELPFACQQLLKTGKYDACIAVGVLIKGSTMHFEYIADAVSHGLMKVGLDHGIPVVFGVLTCLSEEQACERAGIGADSHNHGIDWAETAIQQALLVKSGSM
jgi:6,7-dimethyl-8-ribityllumazine synthase